MSIAHGRIERKQEWVTGWAIRTTGTAGKLAFDQLLVNARTAIGLGAAAEECERFGTAEHRIEHNQRRKIRVATRRGEIRNLYILGRTGAADLHAPLALRLRLDGAHAWQRGAGG